METIFWIRYLELMLLMRKEERERAQKDFRKRNINIVLHFQTIENYLRYCLPSTSSNKTHVGAVKSEKKMNMILRKIKRKNPIEKQPHSVFGIYQKTNSLKQHSLTFKSVYRSCWIKNLFGDVYFSVFVFIPCYFLSFWLCSVLFCSFENCLFWRAYETEWGIAHSEA